VRFVPGGLPGEVVTAVPASARRRYDRMRLVAVERPSPDRRAPLCPHDRVCGGCTLQRLRYER
jgi:23S rRNA (uracil1939-C5)-methyltransferase